MLDKDAGWYFQVSVLVHLLRESTQWVKRVGSKNCER